MIKALFLSLSILLFASAFGQKLVQNETDKFTKQKRLQTSEAKLKQKLMDGIGITLRTVDSTCYLTMEGYGAGVGVVGTTDAAMFLFKNDSTLSILPTSIQSYSTGKYGSYYSHQYHISLDQILILANNDIKSIRRYTSSGYADIDIPEKNQGMVRKIAQLILSNL